MLHISSVFRPVTGDVFKAAVMADSPILFWSFDQANGAAIEDETVNNYDGALGLTASSYAYQQAGKYSGDLSTKFPIILNTGYKASRASSQVLPAPVLRPANYTIMGLVKLPTLSTGDNVLWASTNAIFKSNAGTTNIWTRPGRYGLGGSLRFWNVQHKVIGQSAITYDTTLTKSDVTHGTWYIFHITWNGVISRLYLNGVELASSTPSVGGSADWGAGTIDMSLSTTITNMTDGGMASAFATFSSDIGATRIAAHATAAGF